jgi:hypothetical protein
LDKGRNKRCNVVLYVLQKYLTDSYRKLYEICRQRSPDCRRYMDAKKLINQKNYIMKNKKITEVEIEKIKMELQRNQRSHINESEGEQL